MGSWHKNGYNTKNAQQGWKCRVCDGDNWPKHKVCWTCKAMRSYAEVAASANANHPKPGAPTKIVGAKVPSPGQTLQQQLSSIATQLGEVVSRQPLTEDVMMSQASPSQTQSLPLPQAAGGEEEKQALVAKIKQLESSLASVPEGPECKNIRDLIMQQIDQAKAKISSTKPLGARLDGCREALARAKKRFAAAESLAQSALTAQNVAAAEVTKVQAELTELEGLMAEDARSAAEGSSLEKLQAQMRTIVSQMSCSVHVETGEAQQVMQMMSSLFQQLTCIASKSQMAASAAVQPGLPHPQHQGQALPSLAPQQTLPCLEEQRRLQHLLLQNAAAVPVEGDSSMGEPIVQVALGGG